jgi:hypothetical protein
VTGIDEDSEVVAYAGEMATEFHSKAHCAEVPTKVVTNLERFLPGAVYRQVKNRRSYGTGICSVGECHSNTRGAS